MDREIVKSRGYSFFLVNIECLPTSVSFNVVMTLEESIEELLPYLAASLEGCTYTHGSGVINYMDDGHIVAIYPLRITMTDVSGWEEAENLCRSYFQFTSYILSVKQSIDPVNQKRPANTVLDILRSLPKTNCGLCGVPTCMAFAAKLFRREGKISECIPLQNDPRYNESLRQLQAEGQKTP